MDIKWISVKEQLPEKFISVLIHIPSETPYPVVREGYIGEYGEWVCPILRYPIYVTHWAKMPEPPSKMIEEV